MTYPDFASPIRSRSQIAASPDWARLTANPETTPLGQRLPCRDNGQRSWLGALVLGLSTLSLASGCGMTGPKGAKRPDAQLTMQNMIDQQKQEWQADAIRRTARFNHAPSDPVSTQPHAYPPQQHDQFPAMAPGHDPRYQQGGQRTSASAPPSTSDQFDGRATTGMTRQLADLRDERAQQERPQEARAPYEPINLDVPQSRPYPTGSNRPASLLDAGDAGVVQVGRSNRPLVPLDSFGDGEQRGIQRSTATQSKAVSGGIQQVAFLEPEEELAPTQPVSSITPQPQRSAAIPRDDGPFPHIDRVPTGETNGQYPLRTISHTLDPRVPQPGEVACPTGACPTVLGPYGPESIDPTTYPDEYLCDGGDRGMPFHYEGARRGGIDTEDTIGEFKDENGKAGSTISSKVCIYAPRFAAVRSKSAPVIGEDLSIIAAAHDGVQISGINTRLGIEEQTQRDALRRLDITSRPSGVRAEASEGWLGKVDIARGLEERLISYQSLSFIQEGRLRQSEEPILEFGMQAAGEWSRDMNPVIVAHEGNGHELKAEFKVRQVTGVEDRRAPGELRIVKLADKEVAKPGDVITFTIRFDNLGGRDLFDITIVDNLTPRLQFIEGSVDSKLPGSVEVESNGEGSSLLTFKFDEPLKGQSGGSITFQCRVN